MLDIHQAIVLLTQSDELAPEHREFVDGLHARIHAGEVTALSEVQLAQTRRSPRRSHVNWS